MEIYTIGYERWDLDQFINTLKLFNISFLADVRQVPRSRKKGFSKTSLSDRLMSEKIGYKNFKELGSTKEMRDTLRASRDYDKFFGSYKKMISTRKDHMYEIAEIVSRGTKLALMCFERHAEKCHRSVLANAIIGNCYGVTGRTDIC